MTGHSAVDELPDVSEFQAGMHPGNEEPAEPNFFGGNLRTEKWYLPGSKVQYLEFTIMNEGQRKRFQRKTSRDIKVSRTDRTAAIGTDIAGDREALLLEVTVGWSLIDPGTNQVAPFNGQGKPGGSFAQWMNHADPRLIDKYELAVRDANPWMQDDMDSESIQEEIDRLEKLRDEAIRREQEKANLS